MQSFQETSRLIYFQQQMIIAIKEKDKEKQNILVKEQAIEVIKEKLKKNNLTVEDLEEKNRNYKKKINEVSDKEIH